MDIKRLQELEKLTGLELEPTERARLLADLSALVDFVESLPDVPDHPAAPDDEVGLHE